MGNENKALLGMAIALGGFRTRLFGYFMLYLPAAFIYSMILYVSEVHFLHLKNPGILIELVLLFVFIILPPALPFLFWERSIRKFRRANGFSVYGNIVAEIEQREIDERVRKEHQAFVNNGIVKDGGVDRNDIGYWFGLFEKGAISREEYEVKKAELMK